jgi:DNA-directed RNA polymerase subunit alpha
MKIANPFERFGIESVKYDENENYASFEIYPLERGFGLTIGNALRRVLLSALPGASIFAIEVEGAAHEFSSLPGVQEDVTSIVLNLKDVIFKIDEEEDGNKKLTVSKEGAGVVTAGDIVCPTGVEIVNKDAVIANLAEGGKLNMTLHARRGRGFLTSEQNKVFHPGLPVGVIATDSNYSPVIKVNYSVDNSRVGNDSRYDKLTIEVWTNGSVTPQEAVATAATILTYHFAKFEKVTEIKLDSDLEKAEEVEEEAKVEDVDIAELTLSQRSFNCLKRAGINTVKDLIGKSEDDMMKVRNLGRKSLEEVINKLATLGFTLAKDEA